ncbi:uncharacterized protein LOC131879004 [Tigriopus californicus]|uniref:uncharacterized protein LOC131879004 n=1 Tax=Tigriopus californicus TaxID=6832 RepID=UPI0027DA19AE|nr:uncharacterized protein LOC131879004 [Tigriopus californicus]
MYSRSELSGRGFGPNGVSVIVHHELVLKDGTTLALKAWFPILDRPGGPTFEHDPIEVYCEPDWKKECRQIKAFPTVLEYIPYGKSSYTIQRDHMRHPWLASHGYVVIRADMRGSGDSTGLYFDEYLSQEQQDACELIDWIVEQEWSNGKVGMYGKSWGGFNGLQVAHNQPSGIKAVISLYSTDNRFTDDIHYKGGCVIGNGMLSWAAVMFTWNCRPPHPKFCNDWKSQWKTKMELASSSWIEQWLSHQVQDSYWKHGSIDQDYSRIQIPVLAIGGWHDGYTNAVFRMVDQVPNCRAIIGPWSHDWPDVALPGPQVGLMMECLEFWNHHLKGEKIKRQDEVKKMIWYQCQGDLPPGPSVESWPGKWRQANNTRPVDVVTFQCGENGELFKRTSSEENPRFCFSKRRLSFNGSSGLWCGEWLSFGAPDLAGNQSFANARDATWTTKHLDRQLPMFGFPKVHIEGYVSKGFKGCLVARLCDVFPDGKSRLLSYGVKNLTHLIHEDQTFSIEIQLDAIGYTVNPGHSLSISFSTGFWPTIWPIPSSPKGQDWVVWMQSADLRLPIVEESTWNKEEEPPLYKLVPKLPCYGPSLERRTLRPANFERTLSMGLSNPRNTLQMSNDEGSFLFPTHDMVVGENEECTYSMDGDNANTAKAVVRHEYECVYHVSTADCQKVFITTKCSMRGNATHFFIESKLHVQLNGQTFFERVYHHQIERQCV